MHVGAVSTSCHFRPLPSFSFQILFVRQLQLSELFASLGQVTKLIVTFFNREIPVCRILLQDTKQEKTPIDTLRLSAHEKETTIPAQMPSGQVNWSTSNMLQRHGTRIHNDSNILEQCQKIKQQLCLSVGRAYIEVEPCPSIFANYRLERILESCLGQHLQGLLPARNVLKTKLGHK